MTKCKRRLPVTEKVLQQRLSVIGDPVGGRTSGGGGVVKNIYKRENPNSLRQTQQLISTFHTLNKKLELAKTLPNNDDQLSSIHAELEELGGLHAYQRASLRGGDMSKGWGATGKWILPYLKTEHSRISLCSEHANLETGSPPIKLRLLDVGAITGETYIRHSNILDIVSIDLNSQSPKVTQQDFFKRPLPCQRW
ncbi:hypothetical protein BSLG_007423 [Batrachochytrium salamandrivorans]|nr:hypothetical protein BSLG_007423 [Batrachochytrium salamandrivorans]